MTNQIEVLNDLIQINNDRIQGYTKAIEELKDQHNDLKVLFDDMVRQSSHFNADLKHEVKKLGVIADGGSTTAGKIYRTWMDIKATFTGVDRAAILGSCEFGEDAAKKAYKEALEHGDLTSAQLAVLRNQQAEQMEAHNRIKLLRDNQ